MEGIAEIPAAFREAIAEGVKFNASMETLAIQLGGALRTADPGKYLNFAEAREAGTAALETLRQKAVELGVPFESLAETLAVNLPTLANAGIKSVQDQVEAITLLSQVAASKGLNGNQAQRDIIDLLNGQGMRREGLLTSLEVEGSTDGDAFFVCLRDGLGPPLRAGDVVLMDNLSTHKSKRMVAAIQAHGAKVVFLPTYSPDFNPIEGAWSKRKAYLRKVAARTLPRRLTVRSHAAWRASPPPTPAAGSGRRATKPPEPYRQPENALVIQ